MPPLLHSTLCYCVLLLLCPACLSTIAMPSCYGGHAHLAAQGGHWRLCVCTPEGLAHAALLHTASSQAGLSASAAGWRSAELLGKPPAVSMNPAAAIVASVVAQHLQPSHSNPHLPHCHSTHPTATAIHPMPALQAHTVPATAPLTHPTPPHRHLTVTDPVLATPNTPQRPPLISQQLHPAPHQPSHLHNHPTASPIHSTATLNPAPALPTP